MCQHVQYKVQKPFVFYVLPPVLYNFTSWADHSLQFKVPFILGVKSHIGASSFTVFQSGCEVENYC